MTIAAAAVATACRRTVELRPRNSSPALLARFRGTPTPPVASTVYQIPSIT